MAATQVYFVQARQSACYWQNAFSNKVFLVVNNPSKDQQGQASTMLRANHGRQFNSPKYPKERVAAELSPWAWTLREWYPGVRAQAPHQKEAQTEHRLRPHQLDDGTYADANKAEAAPIEPRTLGSLHKTSFLKIVLFRQNLRNGKREIACKKYNFSLCLQTLSLACPQLAILRNEAKRTICCEPEMHLGEKSMLIT